MNRLAQETSPYLRQHRSNPVDWYPWGEEAFAAARERDVPVLLSVGYSACHWCHVMAHESFEDEATAAVMNELFVNVKVDREERPDVDAIYMDAVQAFSGRGGWPMTVFLTPDGEPFVGGTYFPREQFLDLMRRITEAWTTRRSDVVQQGRDLTAALDRGDRLQPTSHLPGYDVLERAFATLNRQFDAEWGGFGAAPKFPSTMALEFLLRWHLRTSSSTAVEMVATSLDAMVAGGMYDHFGGGFARYSTDRQWVVPHFEKMLYDQALLVGVYLHAWQVTGVASYRLAVEATVSYVLRQLCHRDGGFFSAEDADSEGVEGKFYVWTPDEVRAVLGPDAGAATEWWQMSEAGNFEGSNIPVRLRCPDPLVHPDEIDQLRHQLFEAREQRIRPGLDDKVLTEWNGLMLSALAQAAAAMGRHDWLQAAVRNGEFLLASLRRPDGRWLRSWQDGEARHLAYAADHAALVDAFTRLAEATGETRWIDAAVSTADAMLDLFWDEATGGLFTTGRDAERLITRLKDVLDNATPAANSVAAVALARLAALTGEDGYRRRAEDIVRLLGEQLTAHPSAFAHLLTAVELLGGGLTEVAVVGDRPDLVAEVHGRYLPATVLAWGEPRPGPMWDGRSAGHAYVCRGQTCLPPVTTPDELAATLGGLRRQ